MRVEVKRKLQDPGSKYAPGAPCGNFRTNSRQRQFKTQHPAENARPRLIYEPGAPNYLDLEIEAQGELHYAGRFLPGQVGDLAEV